MIIELNLASSGFSFKCSLKDIGKQFPYLTMNFQVETAHSSVCSVYYESNHKHTCSSFTF